MNVDLITFSDENMDQSAQLCAESAREHGADKAVATWWKYIKQNWYADLPALANASRGPAYWSWKPLVVSIGMEDLRDGDILIYADAGIEFLNNVNYIIDRMPRDDEYGDIFLFGNNWPHHAWLKSPDRVGSLETLDGLEFYLASRQSISRLQRSTNPTTLLQTDVCNQRRGKR